MESTVEQWNIPEGTEVIAADGDKVGKVVAVDPAYVVVEKGFFFPTDYYIPTSAIANYDGDKVYLAVTKDEALNQGWDQQPTADSTSRTGVSGAAGAGATADRSNVAAGDTVRVPVHEEELTATTRPVERGQVRVDKDVVTEERTLDVPVTEEQVSVERRAVDREAAPDATAFQEGTIEVPVRGEEVDVQKRVRVVEEVEIGKQATQRTERVADTVRREEVRVDDAGLAGGAVGGAQTTRWTPTAATDYDLLAGKDVYSADGEKVGTIKGVYHPAGDFAAGLGRHYFLLDPGLMRDWFGGFDKVYLPESAIGMVTADRVDLNLTKDQVKGQNWTTEPAGIDAYRWA
jgi:uncharacterized protein (TIGR02271 family)